MSAVRGHLSPQQGKHHAASSFLSVKSPGTSHIANEHTSGRVWDAFSGDRTTARTRMPLPSKSLTTSFPVKPVAPKTTTGCDAFTSTTDIVH
jgi:hypothetical protein